MSTALAYEKATKLTSAEAEELKAQHAAVQQRAKAEEQAARRSWISAPMGQEFLGLLKEETTNCLTQAQNLSLCGDDASMLRVRAKLIEAATIERIIQYATRGR